MLARLIDTIGACWVLLSLGWVTRFRLSGPYWTWRKQTALAAEGSPSSSRARARLVLEYARWAWRIRRLR